MNTWIRCRLWVGLAALLLAQLASAQITIQKTDLQNVFTAHATIKTYADTSKVVSVGNTGGPNVYDFSSLTFSDSSSYTLYQSSEISFLAARFDLTSLVWGSSTQMIGGNPLILFTQNSMDNLAQITIFDSLQTVGYKSPHESDLQFPATYLMTWSTTGAGMGVDSTFVNNVPTNVTTGWNSAGSYVIDGYGTLVFKGKTHQCLRIKYVEVTTYVAKTFSYFTKDGILLLVQSTKDQNDTGKVTVRSINCITDATVTSVPEPHSIPTAFSFSQNYPNPFNPTTVIGYQIATAGHVTLKVFDVLGREVKTLINERQNAGSHSATFDANTLPSGVYFYRLESGSHSEVKKLVLLK